MKEASHFRPYEYEGIPNLKFLPPVSPDEIDSAHPFIVLPSTGLQTGISGGVVIHQRAFDLLCQAQKHLTTDFPHLIIVLKRGFFPPSFWVKLKAKLAIIGFSVLYPHRADEAGEIFLNEGYGHHQGTGVDLGIYDADKGQYQLSFLPPPNAFSSRELIQRYMNDPYRSNLYWALRASIESAGFKVHPNPVEAKQLHAFLKL